KIRWWLKEKPWWNFQTTEPAKPEPSAAPTALFLFWRQFMKHIVRVVTGVLAAFACTAAAAASYPDRAVTIVVPFPAGGTTDVLARHMGKALSEKWGQPIVIENKSGASGTIGSADVARSSPDGYRLLFTATHHIINPTLLKDTISYDTKAAFSNI